MITDIIKRFEEEFKYMVVEEAEGKYICASPEAFKVFLTKELTSLIESIPSEENKEASLVENDVIYKIFKLGYNKKAKEIQSFKDKAKL